MNFDEKVIEYYWRKFFPQFDRTHGMGLVRELLEMHYNKTKT